MPTPRRASASKSTYLEACEERAVALRGDKKSKAMLRNDQKSFVLRLSEPLKWSVYNLIDDQQQVI